MPERLIILISGRKQAGKNTLANGIAALYANLTKVGGEGVHYWVTDKGELRCWGSSGVTVLDIAPGGNDATSWDGADELSVISFADPIKEFCVHVLGLEVKQVYGSEKDKNSLTHLWWDALPRALRRKYSTVKYFKFLCPRTGLMTAREVMQVFGTDLIRSWSKDAWAKAGISKALRMPQKVVLIADVRFPNEIDAGYDQHSPSDGVHVMTVRLMRNVNNDQHPSETALDDTPLETFDLVIPPTYDIKHTLSFAAEQIIQWMKDARLVPDDAAVTQPLAA